MNPTATVNDQQAVAELARLLPSPVPLAPRRAGEFERPAPDATAVVATFVGQTSAELMVVAQQSVTDAMAGAGALSLAEALRPALEAAGRTLGPGVLGTAETRPAGEVFTGPGTVVYALDAGVATQAWFGIRAKGSAVDAAAPAAPLPSGAMRVLYDVEMTLTTEIGRTRLPVRDVLELTPGAVLELDRSAGSPADVMVNGRLVARGEVVVVDDEYAVRITEIVSTENLG
ncbi:flagellar motor switch protein FliN [Georgenia thermotolerans]|uniref:Flagellar motor switch protein FliN n=1 Tax=Georgenia thermotolerans TaxID=527326 RepID=A0A7J5ULZ9_9MICO|nr:flagellar motor switch protein FliN [Georgenia thermotolerans]KAE8763392.1 flagellar motor switch protein FliN [Georgenia thermotolerans]